MANSSTTSGRWVQEAVYAATAIGRYLLAGNMYPPQFGHNGFEVRERPSPGYFIIATYSEQSNLLYQVADVLVLSE